MDGVLEPWEALARGLAAHPTQAVLVMRAVRDATGTVVDFEHELANLAAERAAGRALHGRRLLELYTEQDATLFPAFRRLLATGGTLQTELEYPQTHDDETLAGHVIVVYARVVSSDQIVCQYQDVTELRNAERLLEHRAGHDSLTGLVNRRLFAEHLEHALLRLHRHPSPLLLMLCDVDHFKRINDTFGHAAGDGVLCELADRLRRALRPEDVIGRQGGDEFVVLCEGVSTRAGAVELAERARGAVTGLYELGQTQVHVSVSVGFTVTARRQSVDEVLSEADAALYAAKHAGRGKSASFQRSAERSPQEYPAPGGMADVGSEIGQ